MRLLLRRVFYSLYRVVVSYIVFVIGDYIDFYMFPYCYTIGMGCSLGLSLVLLLGWYVMKSREIGGEGLRGVMRFLLLGLAEVVFIWGFLVPFL